MDIIYPNILTLITTYKCTAACENCCFNCSPQYSKLMSISEIKEYVSICKEKFPSIGVVVFTGGECTLLKEDLISAIRFCSNLGFITRIVSNGHWGKSVEKAKEYIQSLTDNGLSELNISTGKDHLKYVPLSNIINIMQSAALNEKIKGVVISVEKRDDYDCDSPIGTLRKEATHLENREKIFIVESPWVSFRKRDVLFSHNEKTEERKGCKNIFSGLQINPNGQLLSCCGLACEYSPILKLGNFAKESLVEKYKKQFNDILKLWLYTDGPLKILNQINNTSRLECRHDCDYCLELLTKPDNLKKILDLNEKKAKEIMLKYIIDLKTSIK